jgi:cytochrome c-type protein NapB
MRGAAGKSMNSREKVILIYGAAILFGFVGNQVSANDLPFQEKGKVRENGDAVEQDQRARLRAFYTAPPVISHEVESQDAKDCLRCHLKVTRSQDGRVAMQTPHPQMTSCLQCHAPGFPGADLNVESRWQGLEEPKRGTRWFWTSPPTVPHRIFLRENCLSCHGPENPDMRLRTPHPERTSCLQCHVPDENRQF